MHESTPPPGSNKGFFKPKQPEHLTGEEPEFTLYNLHASEKEVAFYEKMGVKEFRQFYLATIGRLISKTSGEKFIQGTSIEAIDKATDLALKLETMHTVAGAFMVIGAIGSYGNGNFTSGTVSVAFNVLINLYPVFLQRVTRYKLLDAKKRKLAIHKKNHELDGNEE